MVQRDYRRGSRANNARIKKESLTVTDSSLTAAAGEQSFDVVAIPANHVVDLVDINVTEAFTDGAGGTFTCDVGVKGGDVDAVIDGAAIGSIARVDSPKGVSGVPSALFLGGATVAIKVLADVNVDTATAGSLAITVYYHSIADASDET